MSTAKTRPRTSRSPPAQPLPPNAIEKIRCVPGNDLCLDCRAAEPDWADVQHGSLHCIQCAGRHRGLGVKVSVTRSLTMDNWTEANLLAMLLGGNKQLRTFFETHTIENSDIEVLYRTSCDLPSRAVLPYSRALHRFPAYLQQLDMESNGKRVRTDGEPVTYETGPVIWGEPGTNGQHSFHQLLHQGSTVIPADFIVFGTPDHPEFEGADTHHDLLVANCFAQSQALAFGRTAEEVAETETDPLLVSHRTFPGNRPSTTIMAPALTPSVLGQLVALYEHQVFTQGVVWGLNSFDQWGVELGKVLASAIVDELTNADTPALRHDASTNALIERYRSMRGR